VSGLTFPGQPQGYCLIILYPLTRKTSASSLFRPRRNILAVFDGVFSLAKSAFALLITEVTSP
jgi:hypothetical protein